MPRGVSARDLPPPNGLAVLSDRANAVEGNGEKLTVDGDGEGKMVSRFEVQFFEKSVFDGILHAIVDADLERAAPEFVVPADAAQQLPDRFHAERVAAMRP